MALLASTPTRGVAEIMESSIRFHLEYSGLNLDHNLNFSKYPFGREVGDDELHLEHYVYIAVKELPLQEAWRQANNSFATRPMLALCHGAIYSRMTALFARERAINEYIGRNMRNFQEDSNTFAEAGVIRRERRRVADDNALTELGRQVMESIDGYPQGSLDCEPEVLVMDWSNDGWPQTSLDWHRWACEPPT